MFLHLLATDFRRAFGGIRFWGLCVGVAFLLFCNTLNSGYVEYVSFLSAVTSSSFSFTTEILLILATLGYGTCFCEDWKNREIRNILIRCNLRSYAASKILTCAVSAVSILFVGRLLFGGLELLITPSVYESESSNFYQNPMGFDALYAQGNWMEWFLLQEFRLSLEGAGFAVLSLCVSTLMVNPFVVFTLPIFAYFILGLIMQYNPNFPWFFQIYQVYENSSFAFQNITVHMFCTICITVGVCAVLGCLFLRGVRRKMEDG